ncbi:bifunctional 2-polyprenyl-6-hydroxyphenol methylase/3-demethylubiquinol 3-O-methyltransferase UbiG [Cellulomonas sp. URHE0023]|uniref:class I SAM-dependent methyltransferase n=1 Tax=Cellulomonas sp. URHE0023 TaxID=1380354 RepID=UPI000559333A|nr:class I SAM-dependent methyltransferase [Cellulomonas sp. URHE0023]
MSHDQHSEILYTPEFWDERYGSAERIWSGNPNPQLVSVVSDLAPGSALDVGSGEGADAIWLASRGWDVTAVDISQVALDRSAAIAGPLNISWELADVLDWEPGVDRYDLVSAQFMHLPPAELRDLHRRLAGAVRPGGMLLIVGHHPSDHGSTKIQRPDRAELLFTAEDVGVTLDPDLWDVAASSPSRTVLDADGQPAEIRDAVLVAVRRASSPTA